MRKEIEGRPKEDPRNTEGGPKDDFSPAEMKEIAEI